MSVIETTAESLPSRLPQPCKQFNEDKHHSSLLCSFLHVCSSCGEDGHSAPRCNSAAKSPIQKKRKERGLTWDDDVSYSPCAQASETAPPVPDAPKDKLPINLIKVVRDHSELFKVVTPINVGLLERLLSDHPNRSLVKSVIKGFREGFWPYAISPYDARVDESKTQRPLQKDKQDFLREKIAKECEIERYSEPFKPLHKGMACMPIRVGRSQNGKKFRLINDHSFGELSLNSLIPEKERAAYTDDIRALIRILRSRPEDDDIVLFKSDVSQAFRIIPMSPYWQALQTVKFEGKYYVDRCNCFGNAASQRLFCTFLSLVLWIAEKKCRLTDVLSYVDDVFSWDYGSHLMYYEKYDRQLPKKQVKLLQLWDRLGIPHEDKKQEFGRCLTIIGYQVDLRRRRVSMVKERMAEIVSQIMSICKPSSALRPVEKPLKACRELAGTINWALDVTPRLWPGVQSLHHAIVKVGVSEQKTYIISERVRNDLLWVSQLLPKSKGISFLKIDEKYSADTNISICTDASENGFVFWSNTIRRARYLKSPGNAPIHPSIPHALALYAALHWAKLKMPRLKRLEIYTSDSTLVKAFADPNEIDVLHDAMLCIAGTLLEEDLDLQVQLMERKDIILSRSTPLSKQTLLRAFPGFMVERIRDIPDRLMQSLETINATSDDDTGSDTSTESSKGEDAMQISYLIAISKITKESTDENTGGQKDPILATYAAKPRPDGFAK